MIGCSLTWSIPSIGPLKLTLATLISLPTHTAVVQMTFLLLVRVSTMIGDGLYIPLVLVAAMAGDGEIQSRFVFFVDPLPPTMDHAGVCT